MTIWVRVCKSWEDEALADREYWEQFSPDERVALINDLHREWERINRIVESDYRDFADLFESLNRNEVRYVIVGAFAFAFYVKPRYTQDLDIFVEPGRDNAGRLLKALDDFGFGTLGLTADAFEEGQIVQLGIEPHRIDFITRIAAVSFAEAWSSRVPGRYNGVPVYYLGREELKRNKAAAGRPQDLADLAALR